MKKTLIKSIVLIIIAVFIVTIFSSCFDKTIYDREIGLYFKPSFFGNSFSVSSCDEDVVDITIPETCDGKKVISIKARVFENRTNLKSLTIPGNVESIGKSAFSGCINLENVEILDGVESIGNRAFENCKNLKSITIPGSVKSIGEGTFSGCINLENVEILDGVESIGDRAFENCLSLENINLSNSIESIKSYAFKDCINLKNITIPGSVRSIGKRAFSGCNNLRSVKLLDGVQSVSKSAFENCSGLENVILPNSIESIKSYAFKDCINLKSITIPGSVRSIGKRAFFGCDNLESVEVLDGVQSIGTRAFENCVSLRSVILPNSITSIKSYAFKNCDNMKSITIPGGIKTIERRMLSGCDSIENIVVLEGVKSIGTRAFNNCGSLESIVLPDSITSIKSYAFNNCDNLKSITIPGSVRSIGEHAFSGCDNLESVEVLDGVQSIGNRAFENCASLKIINLPDSITSIKANAFKDCVSLQDVSLPKGITVINAYVFSGCKSLKSIEIPNSVSSIKSHAFAYCENLETVVIYDSVKKIGSRAFYGCISLESLYYRGTETMWNGISKKSSWDDNTGEFTLYPINFDDYHYHSYTQYESYDNSQHKKVCECGDYQLEAHTWDSGVVTKEPTATSDGVKTYTCTKCGETKTETLLWNHTHDYDEFVKYDSSQHKKMCDCGEYVLESHTWDIGVVTKEPTATSEGVKKYTCTKCGETKTETLILNHTHKYDKYEKYNSSKHKKVCECGDYQLEDHTWNSGVVTKEPTATSEGVKTYTCTKCGETKTETLILSHTHKYDKYEKYNSSKHKKVCECGDYQLEDHIWNSGVVTKEPTTTSEGVKTYTCTKCGETKTESIAKTTTPTEPKTAKEIYSDAWGKTKALTYYKADFNWEVSGSAFLFSGGFSYKGNAEVRNGVHSGYVESETKGNPKNTYIYSAPHNDIYSIESHLTSESDYTTRAIEIVFSGFSNGLIVELPQSAQSRLTYGNGVLRGDLTESEAKSVYDHMFRLVGRLLNKNDDISSVKVNSADLEITVDSSGIIKEYKMTLKGKSGSVSFTSMIDVVLSK